MSRLLNYLVAVNLILYILLCCQGCATANSSANTLQIFSNDIENLVKELSNKIAYDKYPINIGLGSFFYGNSKMSSDFGFHFSTEVERTVIDMRPQYTLLDRSRLSEILNEIGFQLTDLVDPATVKKPGKIKGLDAILVGNYAEWDKNNVRATLKLLWVENAATAGMVIGNIKGFSASISIRPPNYEVQQQRIDEKLQNWMVEETAGQPPDVKVEGIKLDFHVSIEPEKLDAYTENDELRLYVKSDVDCYIEIYNISSDGQSILIFPNGYWDEAHSQNENLIRAGVRTLIPPDSSFKLNISPPYGIETLKLVASTKPFPPRTNSFYKARGLFPDMGDIDNSRSVEDVKVRVRSVFADSDAPAKVSESYCTILTKLVTKDK